MATCVAELLAESKERGDETQKLSDLNKERAAQLLGRREALQEKCSALER